MSEIWDSKHKVSHNLACIVDMPQIFGVGSLTDNTNSSYIDPCCYGNLGILTQSLLLHSLYERKLLTRLEIFRIGKFNLTTTDLYCHVNETLDNLSQIGYKQQKLCQKTF